MRCVQSAEVNCSESGTENETKDQIQEEAAGWRESEEVARRVECPVRWKLIAEHIDMTWRKITSRNEIDFGAINRPQPHSPRTRVTNIY